MTGTLGALAVAMAAFVASHLALSARPVRARLVSVLGDRGFLAAYTIIAAALLVWAVSAFNAAPHVAVWSPPIGLQHLSLTVLPLACLLIVAGYSTRNPTVVGADTARIIAAGPVGIYRVTRHPIMWGVALWGIAHLLANGDAAGMILFGGLTALALAGAAHSDARRSMSLGEAWAAYRAHTSFVPMAAILTRRTSLRGGEIGWVRLLAGLALYVLLLVVHPWLFGVSPLPGIG